jgi:hypothetical protein
MPANGGGFRKDNHRASIVNPIEHEGYLEKLSTGLLPRWQRRYFFVGTHYLKYTNSKVCVK